jgi:hypothetical protein
MNATKQPNLKEESLRWIFSIAGAVLVYVVVAMVVLNIYHPDTELLKKIANEQLAETFYARPEPMEALLFRLGVLIILPGILCFYALLLKIKFIGKLAKDPYYRVITVLCLVFAVALIYFDFAALNPYGPESGEQAQNKRDAVSVTNFSFYFDGIFLGSYLWVYVFAIVPLLVYLFFAGIKKYHWESKRPFQLGVSAAGYLVAGYSVLAIVLMNTFYFPYTNENRMDFSAVYYSMTQVYAGLPMLADHFTNTYGLYPQILNPVFYFAGLDVLKFSLVMSLLTGLSFVLNFYALKRLVSNKVILFLGFAAILFFPYFDFKILTAFDSVFSYYPIRYLPPSVLIFLSVLYFNGKSAKLYWLTSFFSAFFILWNPEIGMVCYLAWLAANVYNDFYRADGSAATGKIAGHAAAGIGVVLVVFYSYKLIIYLVYGSWPDLSLLFGTIFVFSKMGFGLLPMSLVHPWNLMALTLLCGFTWAATKWYRKDVTVKASMVLLLSLIGLGYFVYFQGRSQNTNFAISSGFCLMLLTVQGDELWKMVKQTNNFLLNGLFVVFLFIISFSFIEIIYNTGKINDLVYQEEDKANFARDQQAVAGNNDFIMQHSQEHEKILVLTQKKSQGIFFDGGKRISAFNPGFIDLFFMKDVARLEGILRDSSFNVFMEPATKDYPYMARPLAAMAASYEYKAVNGTMVLLTKRKANMPEKALFGEADKVIFHRKYQHDAEGMKQRINDAGGTAPAALDTQFSVSVLFYTLPQMFPEATLVGNLQDSSGFAICKQFNTEQYLFVINNVAFPAPLPDKRWIYCVMNVYPHRVEVYANGQLLFTRHLQKQMRQSGNKLAVGNCSTYESRFYVGPIAEVAVANKVMDSSQVKATWSQMKQTAQ